MTRLTPQAARAVRLLSRPVLNLRDQQEIQQLRLMPQDWPAIVLRAYTHRWTGWLLAHARQLTLPLPAESLQQLEAFSLTDIRRTMELDQLLRQLQPLWDRPLPPVLLLKGRGIERRAYPPGILRPIVDIDLLVRPGHDAELADFLRSLQMLPTWTSRAGHVTMWSAPEGPVVEVHTRPLDPWRFAPMMHPRTVERWFTHAVQAEGRLEPDPLDQTAFLLVHLLEGVYCDTRHLGDLLQWLRVVQPEPREVLDRLRQWQALRAGLTGLQVVLADEPELHAKWAPLLTNLPLDVQALLARETRRLAEHHHQQRIGDLPRWLEGAGLGLHLDQPVRWALSWTPLKTWMDWQ